MVYGFVKQSGGHVKIYSEVGHGTTIKLYLPRAMEAEDVEVAVDTGPITGGTETVLVVEDDAEVRATVVELLSDLGYRVLKAVDAQSALNVIESGIPIDMLFTDVVMPGTLKSPELARKARERLPDIAVLFTSGYTENSIVHGGRLDRGVELLSKPYTREALARKFRHVLANQRQRRMATSEAPSTRSEPPVEEVRPQPLHDGRTILLVEDDDLIRMSTAETLQDAGFVVVHAVTAEEAMTALQTAQIDVLVTDLNCRASRVSNWLDGKAVAADAIDRLCDGRRRHGGGSGEYGRRTVDQALYGDPTGRCDPGPVGGDGAGDPALSRAAYPFPVGLMPEGGGRGVLAKRVETLKGLAGFPALDGGEGDDHRQHEQGTLQFQCGQIELHRHRLPPE